MAQEEKVEVRRAPRVPKAQPPPPQNQVELPPLNAPIDRGPEVVATTLAPQLGSNTKHLAEGDFDMRKLSVIEGKDIPLLIYAKIRGKKSAAWQDVYDMFLNLQVSVGGRGRRDIIRMEGVSKGGLPDYQPEMEKPGWFSRNFVDRSWKKRAQDEMV